MGRFVHRDERLADGRQERVVAADADLMDRVGDRRHGQGRHLGRRLRVGETLQPVLAQRIHPDDPGAALHRILKLVEDARRRGAVQEVFVADIGEDGMLGPLAMIIGDLPDSGQHPNRVMAFGPDGMLYISVGSTFNACNESNPENATILGRAGRQEPHYLRLRAAQYDRLRLESSGRRVWGDGGLNPQSTPVGGITKQQWREQSTPMVLGYSAHAAPMQMKFYAGSAFPAAYQGDAFATMRGSWNRNPASG